MKKISAFIILLGLLIVSCKSEKKGNSTDAASGAKSVLIGDFRRGYMIVDRVALSVLRDPYSQASTGLVRYLARKRVGGEVVLAEAMRVLKHSVS